MFRRSITSENHVTDTKSWSSDNTTHGTTVCNLHNAHGKVPLTHLQPGQDIYHVPNNMELNAHTGSECINIWTQLTNIHILKNGFQTTPENTMPIFFIQHMISPFILILHSIYRWYHPTCPVDTMKRIESNAALVYYPCHGNRNRQLNSMMIKFKTLTTTETCS